MLKHSLLSSQGNNRLQKYGNLHHQIGDDIRHLIGGLHWAAICCIRRNGNRVAHVLAQHARFTIDEDLYWMEDSPPPAIDALYIDLLSI